VCAGKLTAYLCRAATDQQYPNIDALMQTRIVYVAWLDYPVDTLGSREIIKRRKHQFYDNDILVFFTYFYLLIVLSCLCEISHGKAEVGEVFFGI
jgi:hypothetical protein